MIEKELKDMSDYLTKGIALLEKIAAHQKSKEYEQEIPQGIVSFKNFKGVICEHNDCRSYETWASDHLRHGEFDASTIHSICIGGVTWTVGEEVGVTYKEGVRHNIKSFKHINRDLWMVFYEDGKGCDFISKLRKLPSERHPVCPEKFENNKILFESIKQMNKLWDKEWVEFAEWIGANRWHEEGGFWFDDRETMKSTEELLKLFRNK